MCVYFSNIIRDTVLNSPSHLNNLLPLPVDMNLNLSKLRSTTFNFRKMPSRTDDILKGFRVNWVNLRDNNNGKILWQGNMDISLGISLLQYHLNNRKIKAYSLVNIFQF